MRCHHAPAAGARRPKAFGKARAERTAFGPLAPAWDDGDRSRRRQGRGDVAVDGLELSKAVVGVHER